MFEEIRKALFPTPDEIMEKIAEYERLAGQPFGIPQPLTVAQYVKIHGTPTRCFEGTCHDN